MPLLIALHGRGGDGRNMEGLSNFVELADSKGFVVVLPSSCDLDRPWAPTQDLAYIASTITRLTSNPAVAGAIDRSRVYVTGFSAGGQETWLVGCRMSGRVAAIASVSSSMDGVYYDSCHPSRPLPALLMAGTLDSSTWPGVPGSEPSALQTVAFWRGVDHCRGHSVRTRRISAAVIEQTWAPCAARAAVRLYTLRGAGHVWPPYGTGSPQLAASELVWEFVSAFRTPGARR